MGGMAEILLGRLEGPSGFERPVVLKRILPHLAQHPSFVEMFLDEGRIAARVRHPNVVQVQDLCQVDGELFLVMEFLEGESAAGLARRARARRMRIAYGLCAHIVAEACAGLHAAHELTDSDGMPLDVVHRDVSPQNIFVGYDGTVRVLDFGIAKAADRITRTEAGLLKGKFEYMSPEQASGELLDRRCDVFSLGIVLYELSTQRRLFKRSAQPATLRAVTDDPILPPSAIDPDYPPALESIVLHALERDRGRRHQTAWDLRKALLSFLHDMHASELTEESLRNLMRKLFEDRIADKREMLRRIHDGVTPSFVPEADVDVAVELPSIELDVASQVRTRPLLRRDDDVPPRRKRGGWVALGAMLLALMGVGVFVALEGRSSERAAERAAPVAMAPGRGEPSAPVEGTVTILVDSAPAGAQVRIDGRVEGRTPVELSVPRSAEPLTLRLQLDGFVDAQETIVPNIAQRLRLSLTPEPRERRSERPRPRMSAPAARADPEPSSEMDRERAFRRFN